MVSAPGSATSLYPPLQYSSFMRTLNSKAEVTPAMSMLQTESSLQSIGTPSDQDKPGALPRRNKVFPKPMSTFATMEVLGAAFFGAAFFLATLLAGAFFTAAFLATAFLAGALGVAAFLAGDLAATFLVATFFAATFFTAAFFTAFLAAFLAAAIVVFFMS